MKKYIFTIALCAAANVMAGPFGVSQGMTLEELKKQGEILPGKYKFSYTATTIANGHPDFEIYSIVLTPQHGLCKITASGKDIESSSFGNEIKSKFTELTSALSGKYGNPGTKNDFLQSGSIWNDGKDWMMGLLKKERVISAYWIAPKNNNLPDSIDSIGIEAVATSSSKGYIRIAYEFKNFDSCYKILKEKNNSSL